MESIEEIFKVIHDYHQLSFSQCLRVMLREKQITIPNLHQKLIRRGYYLSLESLYRYFNPNLSSNRFPSQAFLRIFAELVNLSDEQMVLLLKFWYHCKLARKS
jgi:hypothetical protein